MPTTPVEYPFAEGAFRLAAKGWYISGRRDGQACVIKWFKSGAAFSVDYFALDMKVIDKALQYVDKFNQLNFVDKIVKINVAEVWEGNFGWEGASEMVFCEPFIQKKKLPEVQ